MTQNHQRLGVLGGPWRPWRALLIAHKDTANMMKQFPVQSHNIARQGRQEPPGTPSYIMAIDDQKPSTSGVLGAPIIYITEKLQDHSDLDLKKSINQNHTKYFTSPESLTAKSKNGPRFSLLSLRLTRLRRFRLGRSKVFGQREDDARDAGCEVLVVERDDHDVPRER
jgi:hypothetical protein